MSKILNISILGYGIKINYFGYFDEDDGSLEKYGIEIYKSKFANPNITFIINYRWFCFTLLLNRS